MPVNPVAQDARPTCPKPSAMPGYARADLTPASCISASAISTARTRPSISTSCSTPAWTRLGVVGAGVSTARRCRASAGGAGLADHRGRAGCRPQQARVTGAMIDFLPPGDPQAIVDAARRPRDPHRLADDHRGRLLHRPGAGKLRPDASRHRRRRARTSTAPRTVFGLILAGLMRRRDDGIAPFTVMSCDNIPRNGHVAAGRRRRARRA